MQLMSNSCLVLSSHYFVTKLIDFNADLQKQENTVVAVEGTTLDIYKDQITVIVGENGAGKTTTMDMIVGKFFLFSNNSD